MGSRWSSRGAGGPTLSPTLCPTLCRFAWVPVPWRGEQPDSLCLGETPDREAELAGPSVDVAEVQEADEVRAAGVGPLFYGQR